MHQRRGLSISSNKTFKSIYLPVQAVVIFAKTYASGDVSNGRDSETGFWPDGMVGQFQLVEPIMLTGINML